MRLLRRRLQRRQLLKLGRSVADGEVTAVADAREAADASVEAVNAANSIR
jgi:hypothetical protein